MSIKLAAGVLTLLGFGLLLGGTVSSDARAAREQHARSTMFLPSKSVPFPSSIGAAGDSVTQAFDVNSAGALQDNPQDSWSTGTSRAVDSEYARILARDKRIAGHRYNVAVAGATMSALDAQLRQLVAKRVRYATVLMGHDDLCTSSIRTMTPVSAFATQFQRALSRFLRADTNAHVFVSSLLSVYRLWQVMHRSANAERTWGPLARRFTGQGICQSMLNPKNTQAQRRIVNRREVSFNAVMSSVCLRYARCRWDHDVAFHYRFPASFVSTVDYFHPSVRGQHVLAALAWSQSYWSK